MNMFDAISYTSYPDHNGIVESVQPFEKIAIETAVGQLVPIHAVEDHGRKKLTPVKLHKNGAIKSMSLQDATVIPTSIGELSAELVTFYESGALRRVFPLNGKLSGYWTEKNEFKLAEPISIPTSVGTICAKPIYMQFYETGELQSIVFWPQERVTIEAPIGKLEIKNGISFHKNGALASCEPAAPVRVETPVGSIEAHDPDPNGMIGEKNSLSFTPQGELSGLSTTNAVVNSADGDRDLSFSPVVERSMCSDTAFTIRPLRIAFRKDVYLFWSALTPRKAVSASADFSVVPFHTDKVLAGIHCSL